MSPEEMESLFGKARDRLRASDDADSAILEHAMHQGVLLLAADFCSQPETIAVFYEHCRAQGLEVTRDAFAECVQSALAHQVSQQANLKALAGIVGSRVLDDLPIP